jgi:hypothetical protein
MSPNDRPQSDAELQFVYKLANAPILAFPYPHIYVPDVFPADFYARLQQNLPDPKLMIPIEKARPVTGYKEERYVLELSDEHLATLPEEKRAFWADMAAWLLSGRILQLALSKFAPYVQQRFEGTEMEFYDESLLVEDVTNYKLTPHTDAAKKVVTMLFYLPKDDSQSHLGTSIYLPKDSAFVCPGGPHHPPQRFVRLTTMPFRPNSLFAFVKSDNSFHGVEPVADPDTKRWLLLYDVFGRKVEPEVKPAAKPVSAPKWA